MDELVSTTTSDQDYYDYVKLKLKSVCLSAKFCGLCLQSEGDLHPLDLQFIINNQKYTKCLHDILNYVFNDDIKNLTSSSYVCKICTNKVMQCYTFIHNVKQTLRLMDNCVDDMSTKIDYIHNQFDTTFDLDTSVIIAADTDNKDLYYSIINTDRIEILPIVYPRIVEEQDLKKYNFKSSTVKVNTIKKKVGRKRKYLPTDTFPCKICPKVFAVYKRLARHEREVHSQVWTCDLCDQYFTSKREFKAHYKTHDQEKAYMSKSSVEKLAISSQTPKVDISEIRLTNETSRTAVTKVVKPPANVTCADCSEKFATNRALRTHVKAVHNKSYYECELCDQTYTTWYYLIKHYNTVHDLEKCKYCEQIFPLNEFMQHLKTEHIDLVFPCRFCDLVYYSSDSLVTHFHVSHLVNTNEVQPQCVMCLKDVNPDQLKYHRIRCRFSCAECSVMPCIHYKYLASYREQVLNKVKKIKCLDCDYTFSSKLTLVGHINQAHLDHHPFTCDHCQQQFYSKLKLKTHIVLFHLDNRCEYCDVVFTYIVGLENHKKRCKTNVRPFGCSKCKASFDSEENLTSHDALRHNENVYICGHCSCTFLEYTELEEHIEREHSGVLRPGDKKKRMCTNHVHCSLCDVELKSIEELNQHQKLHSHTDKFACIKCDQIFGNLSLLYSHNLKHKINKTVNCKYCNKKMQGSRHREHEAYCFYNSNKKLSLVCEECGQAFSTKSALIRHAETHMKKKPCPECQKPTRDLKKHMRLVHGPRQPRRKRHVTQFRCTVCNHTVQARRALDAHMNRFHLKIKPYSCNECGQTFFGENRLTSHMLTHTEEKVCYCSVCGKRYSDPVCLKRHFRTHTGDLPYCCDLCGEKFRTSSLMNVHRLKKHFEKTISCPFCDNMFHVLGEMRSHFRSVHWKVKDKPFDVREVRGLSEEHYHLFEDRRFPKLE